MKYRIFFLSIIILLTSCEESKEIHINPDSLLIGSWINPIYNGNEIIFTRSTELPENSYGIKFKENGIYTERTSGWCATPPLLFSDYNGDYSVSNNKIIINDSFSDFNKSWEIIDINTTNLVVNVSYKDQELEQKALMDLFAEIEALAFSVSCFNISEWNYTPYGSKACGGPQGYLPYSNQIDVDEFLRKVNEYKIAEETFNNKWEIVSDCSIIAAPKRIVCEDGKPTLVF